MALKRVSSHINSLASQVSGGIDSLVSTFTGALENKTAADQGKVAAQLLKKSPLEINDSPIESIKKDPLDFSFITYPNDLAQTSELGHYILFYTLKNNFTKGSGAGLDYALSSELGFTGDGGGLKNLRKVGNNTVKQVNLDNSVLSSVQSSMKIPTHSQVTSAIALYMPAGIKVSDTANYTLEETDLAGTLASTVGNVAGAKTTGEQLTAVLGGAGAGLADYIKREAGAILSGVGIGDPFKLLSKAGGFAFNPHEEMFYKSPGYREFTYSFEFWPKSRDEVEKVENIIKLFRYHMYPNLDMSLAGGRIFFAPSEFEIHYMHRDKENEHLNKISRCVLKNADVTYGPEAQNSFFTSDERGAAPVTHKLNLTFAEMEYITKEKVYKGF